LIERCEEPVAEKRSMSKDAGYANGADGVQFVCVIDDFRLEGEWIWFGPVAMGSDGMGNGIHERSRLIVEDLSGALGPPQMMSASGMLQVVQKGGGSDYLQIGALLVGDALCQGHHTQHVVEIMRGIFGIVEPFGLSYSDQDAAPLTCFSEDAPLGVRCDLVVLLKQQAVNALDRGTGSVP
jgi:hypothetical protein